MSKFVFVTGGVVSSLGKGIAVASIGLLLNARGLRVALLKLDPYLNVDPAGMDPAQHGEIYVTDDGGLGDLDLGHYERFTGIPSTKNSNVTTGRIYHEILRKERAGHYKGGTVQVVPHVTDAIKEKYTARGGRDVDVVIVELGGTVGDIEGLPFIESFRQFRLDRADDVFFVHLSLVPYLSTSDEIKTKPTQHSVQKLREFGIQPDMLLCRTERPLSDEIKGKIARFCNVRPLNVVDEPDVDGTVYEVPLMLHERNVDGIICEHFGLAAPEPDLADWKAMVDTVLRCRRSRDAHLSIGVVGPHHDDSDVYKSLYEALVHAGVALGRHVKVEPVRSDLVLRDGAEKHLSGLCGLIAPGGAGNAGVEGTMAAVEWARLNGLPFLGIGQGMHCAVVNFARSVAGIADATSLEWEDAAALRGAEDGAEAAALLERCFVVTLNQETRPALARKPELRVGRRSCMLSKDSRARAAYEGAEVANERHCQHYEINPDKLALLEKRGLKVSGLYADGQLAGMVEIPEHPFFIATIAHPEFHSRPLAPHPLFKAFLAAAEAAAPARAKRTSVRK